MLELLVYVEVVLLFMLREADVPAGLLYDAVDLPCTALVDEVLLVPNEFLLVVDTRLTSFPDDGELLAMTRLPVVSKREPL